jgi:hypothetical protein
MTLQSSGSISISQIKAELGSSSNSLRDLSAAAGKSTPDSMSEFYGYSATPVSYLYSIIAYSGYVTVSGTYTTKTGGTNTSFSFYNSSPSGGVVGSVCAQLNTVNVTSGNGTKSQGSVC